MLIGPVERYEITADAFHWMTGMMAPGKNAPACGISQHSYMERRDAWEQWVKDHGVIVDAIFRAIEYTLPEPPKED